MSKAAAEMLKLNKQGAYIPVKMKFNPRASCDVFVPREKKIFRTNPNEPLENRVSPPLQVRFKDYSERFSKAQLLHAWKS